MPDSSYVLQITTSDYGKSAIHQLTFESKDDAMAQLAILEPLMGLGKFRNDPEKNRCRLSGPDGDIVVVVEHVLTARVCDHAAFRRGAEFMINVEREDLVRQSSVLTSAIVAALKADRP